MLSGRPRAGKPGARLASQDEWSDAAPLLGHMGHWPRWQTGMSGTIWRGVGLLAAPQAGGRGWMKVGRAATSQPGRHWALPSEDQGSGLPGIVPGAAALKKAPGADPSTR